MIPGIVAACPTRPCARCGHGGATVERDLRTGLWWVRCQRCGHDGPRSADRARACKAWDDEERPWWK